VDGDNHVLSFNHEEYHALMALLKSSKSEASSSHQINSFSTHIASSSSNVQQGTVISASCFSVVSSLDTWILDSGATHHVCSSLSLFTKYHNVNPIPVKLPNGSIVTTDIVGDINVTQHITLHNVLYMPKFSFNLISISRVSLDLDCAFVFTDNLCYIQNSMQKMIGSGRQIDGLYYLEGTSFESSKTSTDNTCNSVVIPKSALWHFRFGHTSHDRLEAMQKLYSDIVVNKDGFCCDICHLAKQRKLSYKLSTSRASKCIELLHMDLWGPFSVSTTQGHKYFLTIVDDFNRFTWIVLLKGKYEAALKIQEFITSVEVQFESTVKTLRSDNGPEFLSLSTFYACKGIIHQTSCVATPQQNGRVERKH
jgi:hypothetical protein